MKQFIQKQFLTGLLLFTALFSLVPTQLYAIAGTIYFNRNGETFVNGSQFTIEVKGKVPKPGGIGGGTTTIVTYDQTKLQEIDHNDTNGVFVNGNPKNWNETGAGKVRYESRIAWNAPAVNDQKIISITFKVVGTGTTTLNFAPGTSIHNGPTTGTASTFTLIAASCPSGQVGTPPNCSNPAPSPSPSPSGTPTPSKTPSSSIVPRQSTAPIPTPVPTTEVTQAPTVESNGGLAIENVKTTINRQKNTVTWTMNTPDIEPTLSYGLTKSNLSSKATVNKLSDGSFEGVFTDVKPGTLYYFAIDAATPDLLKSTNYKGTFTTKGYPVQITVKLNGELAPKAKVAIADRSFVANDSAVITADFGDGSYSATVTPENMTSSYEATIIVKKVTIPSAGEPELQKLTLDGTIEEEIETAEENYFPLLLGVISAATGFGMVAFVIYRKKHNDNVTDSTADSDLLISNYGDVIDNSRLQTPEPNLDVQASLTIPTVEQTDTLTGSPNQAVSPTQAYNTTYITVADEDETSSPVASNNPEQVYQQNESVLPLPPVDDTTYSQTETFNESSTPQQYDEQLSEQVVAVESITNNDDTAANYEEAVYHPETGELDIIHNNHPPLQQKSTAISEPPQTTQAPAINDTDVSTTTEISDNTLQVRS